jgi:Leucine-rich repeat (LRR) protein
MQKGRTGTRPSSSKPSSSSTRASPSSFRDEPKYAIPIIPNDVVDIDDHMEAAEQKKEDDRRKKRRIMMRIALIIFLIIIIVILIVVLSGGDEPKGTFVLPETCEVNGTRAPETYDEYRCDLLATLDGDDSTYFSSLPTSTAQGAAIGWMTEEDEGADLLTTPPAILMERFVMAVIYYATDGFGWYNKFDFLTPKSHCDWDGERDQIFCDDENHVKVMDLHSNGLNGPLPTEIGYLTHLTRLRLSNNKLFGKIPTQMGDLTELRKLYLLQNEFEGRFPTELNELTHLETLLLQNNDLLGSVDTLCDAVNDTGIDYEFKADCKTDQISCDCCEECF